MSSHIKENKDVQIPSHYIEYHQKISKYIENSISVAQTAKNNGLDISEKVESQIGYDLPDRIAKIHEIDISSRLRTLLPELGKRINSTKDSGRNSPRGIWRSNYRGKAKQRSKSWTVCCNRRCNGSSVARDI